MHAFRIGRVFGIDIRVDWSWVFIFVLMTWNLFAVFSRWHPDWPALEGGAIAVSATLLFFGCILLHELAHALVAMGYDVKVCSITLFLFGGVANIEQEPPSPRAEFFTAIVGPLTSVALGIFFTVLAGIAVDGAFVTSAPWTLASTLGPIATLLVWLGPINILIGVFNMVPAFPLDGGRVLRSIVWHLSGNLRIATRWVSALGQAVGWAFIMLGIAMTFGARIPFFGTGFVGGLWLAFIGWFLNGAAGRATARIDIEELLAGHRVAELMRRHGPVVAPEVPLESLVHDYFMQVDERTLPVVRDGHLLGLVTMKDVSEVSPDAWAATPTSAVMHGSSSLFTATPETPVNEALGRLGAGELEPLPVLRDGGELVGMLRRIDVARFLELLWRDSARGLAGGGSRGGFRHA